jgi:hypothetical protein
MKAKSGKIHRITITISKADLAAINAAAAAESRTRSNMITIILRRTLQAAGNSAAQPVA